MALTKEVNGTTLYRYKALSEEAKQFATIDAAEAIQSLRARLGHPLLTKHELVLDVQTEVRATWFSKDGTALMGTNIEEYQDY